MSDQPEQPEDTRIPLTTSDPLGERVEVLRDLVPEAFVEGEIDFDRLRRALGDSVAEGRERYGLSWAGKADAIRDALRGMIELAPQRIVCLDAAFKGNDQLKTNTVLEMRSHDIEFRTV